MAFQKWFPSTLVFAFILILTGCNSSDPVSSNTSADTGITQLDSLTGFQEITIPSLNIFIAEMKAINIKYPNSGKVLISDTRYYDPALNSNLSYDFDTAMGYYYPYYSYPNTFLIFNAYQINNGTLVPYFTRDTASDTINVINYGDGNAQTFHDYIKGGGGTQIAFKDTEDYVTSMDSIVPAEKLYFMDMNSQVNAGGGVYESDSTKSIVTSINYDQKLQAFQISSMPYYTNLGLDNLGQILAQPPDQIFLGQYQIVVAK